MIDGKQRFEELVADGIVWFDEETGEYVGRASDGAEVSLGIRGEERSIYHYLANRPNPENW